MKIHAILKPKPLLVAISFTSLILYPQFAYAQGGVPLWTNRYAGPVNSDDSAAAIAVDRNGNVFVAGTSREGVSSYGVIIAYSNGGTPLWTNWTLAGGLDFGAGAIAVGVRDNLFVTGVSWNGSDGDYATIKYSNTGAPLWTNRYNAGYDGATGIAVDTNGNVFVTGESDANGNRDYATIAYSNSGLPLWTNRYDGPSNGDDFYPAIVVDTDGDVVVAGGSYGTGSVADYATVKYSNMGQPLWTNRYDGPGNGSDGANAIAVDSGGNVFVTGWSTDVAPNYDFLTIKYSNAGVPLWTNRYNGEWRRPGDQDCGGQQR